MTTRLIAAATLAGVWCGLCGPVAAAQPVTPDSGKAAPPPRATDVLPRRLEESLLRDWAGHKAVTRPSQDAVMGFSLATQVAEILVRGGQEVTKGQVLIRGDDTEDAAILAMQKYRADTNLPVDRAAKAREQADKEYEIQLETLKRGGSTQQQVDRARVAAELAAIDVEIGKYQIKQEQLQVPRLQARLEKFSLRAPFNGVIDSINADLGQAVAENEKILRMVNVDPLWLDVPAPTDDPAAAALKVGDPAWVLVDLGGQARVANGKVIEVAPTADPASRRRRVRVELPNPKGPGRILAGEPGYVRFAEPAPAVLERIGKAAGSTN